MIQHVDANEASVICASGSGVEYNLAKVGVAGSNPVSRFCKTAESGLFYITIFWHKTKKSFFLNCIHRSVIMNQKKRRIITIIICIILAIVLVVPMVVSLVPAAGPG